MSQYYRLPATSVNATNPSVGTNSSGAPTSSTQIAGVDGAGDLIPVSVDASGAVNVSVVDSALPTGAATEATLSALSGKLPASLGAKATTASLSVTPATGATFSILNPDNSIVSTITAADAVVPAPANDGTFRSGASTSGSIVATVCQGGDSAWNMQITGTVSGTYYFEGSINSSNGTNGDWISLNARQAGVVNSVISNSTTTGGFFRGNTSGMVWIRLRNVGGVGLNTGVKIQISAGVGATYLNASVPAGTNAIGSVSVSSSALPSGASTAALQSTGNTSLSSIDGKTPALGQAAMAASTPVVIASNQTPISTIQSSVVSTTNSTTTPLAGGATFTGAAEACQDYASISVTVFSNVASAALGLSIQQSQDGTNWDFTDTYTVPAGSGVVFSASPAARFCRVVYTNGITAQATFRLQTIYHYSTPRSTTHGLADTIPLQSDAELTIAQLRATNGVNAIPLVADSTGNLGTNVAAISGVAPAMGGGQVTSGTLRVVQTNTATSAVTSVAASASSVTILAQNLSRSGAAFYNDSTAICYLKLGATASTTSYTVQLPAGAYYELPTTRCYVGVIDAIWASATGSLRVTELS